MPPTRHDLLVQRSEGSGSWGVGRAGMHYRDLIPGRLGGSVIASHIRIPDGGPVPDMVHYHVAVFQLIYCYRGWVRVVYEDQGPPFTLDAGDCLIQPPEIRHRVLESSANAEVIELAAPARHPTMIDHELTLPTAVRHPERDFGGQRFCHHRRTDAVWRGWRLPGFEACGTGIAAATGGVADARVARRVGSTTGGGSAAGSGDAGPVTNCVTSHDADILFTFVLEGRMTLRAQSREAEALNAGDAFVLPPGTRGRLRTVLGRPGAAGSIAAGGVRDRHPREPLMRHFTRIIGSRTFGPLQAGRPRFPRACADRRAPPIAGGTAQRSQRSALGPSGAFLVGPDRGQDARSISPVLADGRIFSSPRARRPHSRKKPMNGGLLPALPRWAMETNP